MLGYCDRLSGMQWDRVLLRVASCCSKGTLMSLSATWIAAIRRIATISYPLVYLRASQKGHTRFDSGR